MKQEFTILVAKLKAEREEMQLKMHLASMEAKEEFSEAERKWHQIEQQAHKIADNSVEMSEDLITSVKIIGEELQDTYQRIATRIKN